MVRGAEYLQQMGYGSETVKRIEEYERQTGRSVVITQPPGEAYIAVLGLPEGFPTTDIGLTTAGSATRRELQEPSYTQSGWAEGYYRSKVTGETTGILPIGAKKEEYEYVPTGWIVAPSDVPAFVGGGVAGVEAARAGQAAPMGWETPEMRGVSVRVPKVFAGAVPTAAEIAAYRVGAAAAPMPAAVVQPRRPMPTEFVAAAREPPAPFGEFAAPTPSTYLKAGNILQASAQILAARKQDLDAFNWQMSQASFLGEKLDKQAVKLSALSTEIDSRFFSLDLSDAGAVDTYNAAVARFNALREQYNAQVNEVNFILDKSKRDYPTIYSAATVLQAAPSAAVRDILAKRGLSRLEAPPPKPTIIEQAVEVVAQPARDVWGFVGPTAESAYAAVSPYAEMVENLIYSAGELKAEESFFAIKGRPLMETPVSQMMWELSFRKPLALKRHEAIVKGEIPLVEQYFGLPLEEAKFRAYGGTAYEIGSLFLPGKIGVARQVVAALSLPSAKEAAKYGAIGVGLGAAFKGIERVGQLGELGLGAVGAKKIQAGYQKIAGYIGKYGMPAVSAGFVAVSAAPIVEAIEIGEVKAAREMSRQVAGGLGAMQLGGMIGSSMANRLTRELELHILKMQAMQRFEVPQAFVGEEKVTVDAQTVARNIDRIFWETRGKLPRTVEDLPVQYLKALKGDITAQKATREVLVKWGEMGVVPFGSTVQYPSLKGIRIRLLGDIDAIIAKLGLTPKTAMTAAQKIFKKYGLGERLEFFQTPAGEIESGFLTKAGKSEHLFSIHKPEMLFANVEQMSGALEFPPFLFSKTKSGYYILTPRLQWKMKVSAGYLSTPEVKDILDLETIYKGSSWVSKEKGAIARFFADQTGQIKSISADLKKISLESQLATRYYFAKIKKTPLPYFVPLRTIEKTVKALAAGYTYDVSKLAKSYLPMAPAKKKIYPKYEEYKPPAVYPTYESYKYKLPYEYPLPYKAQYKYPSPYKALYEYPKPYKYKQPTKYLQPYKPTQPYKYKYLGEYKMPYKAVKPYEYKQPYEYKIPKVEIPPPRILIPRARFRFKQPALKLGKGFDVFVKVSGKFRKLNQLPLVKESALALGGKFVEERPAATFKLVPTRFAGVRIAGAPKFRPERFRPPIRKGKYVLGKGIFIERAKYRIDLPKEFTGITYKGLAALRQKRAMTALGFYPKKKKKKKSRR